ncbi:5775_t:CDS:2, partial [Rhizophagus irregularis]
VKVYSQILTIKPDLRYDHTATLIRDGLYIIGGATPDGKTPNYPFLFLDVSIPFDTKQLKWHDLSNLSNNDIVPSHQFAAAIKGGADNNTLFLYGGMNLDNNPMSLVYTLNNLSWDTPKINGTPPNGKLFITPVIDYNGLIYLFGGYSTENIYTNDMFILDSINLSWKNVSSINAPSPRIEYSAVFLPNKKIIYMVNDIWTTQMTGGSIPSARFAFSSVLGLDGQRIIIFGGMNSTHIISEALYVLDLNNYNWYIPSFFEQQLNARAEHKTVLIDKYMVITFGVVIGVVFGSTFVAILLLIGSYYLRKWYKNKKEQTDTITTPEEEHPREILRIPGEKNTQDQNQQPTSTSQILQISGNTSNSLQNNEMIQEVRDENKGIPTSGEDHREDHP